MKITIALTHLEDVCKKLDRLIKKANKHGINFTYIVVGESYYKTISVYNVYFNEMSNIPDHKYQVEVIDLELSNTIVCAIAPLFASTSNNSKGCRMTTKSISTMVKESFVYVGLESKRLTAHSLRHTAATLSLIKGKELGIIDILEQTRQLLRRAKLETTLIYAHHIDRKENMSEERIADAIFS